MKCTFFDSLCISFSRYAHLIWEGFKCGCMFQIPGAPTHILATDQRVEVWCDKSGAQGRKSLELRVRRG